MRNMSEKDKRRAVWKPDSPTAGFTETVDFFADKVESIDQRTNSESSTTTIDRTITATTHDTILFMALSCADKADSDVACLGAEN